MFAAHREQNHFSEHRGRVLREELLNNAGANLREGVQRPGWAKVTAGADGQAGQRCITLKEQAASVPLR